MKFSNWLLTLAIIIAINPISCGDSSKDQATAPQNQGAPVNQPINQPTPESNNHKTGDAKPAPGDRSPTPTPPVIGPTPTPTPTGPTNPIGQKTVWADVVNIFGDKCIKCHAAGGKRPLDKPTLVWNGKTRAEVLTALTNSVANNTMPPKDKPQLTEAEKTTVLKWVDDGGLE